MKGNCQQQQQGAPPRRVLLVGQAPNRGSLRSGAWKRPGIALTGAVGRKLARLSGLDWLAYLRWTERVNVLNRWPGALAFADQFPSSEARVAAAGFVPTLDGRRVLFLGLRVARAFDLEGPMLRWEWFSFAVRMRSHSIVSVVAVPGERQLRGYAVARCAVLPHPSGRCRWWNDGRNLEAARRFLTRTFEAYL